MLKTAFFGIGTLFAGVAMLAGWGSVAACQNLDDTSPLFDAAAATDYDAGYVPPAADEPDDDGTSGQLPEGPTPNTLRVRLANLTQGGQALQLCVAQAPSTAFVVATDVSTAAKLDAVGAGLVSVPVNVGPITTAATGRFSFRVGTDCTTGPGSIAPVLAPTAAFKGGASITLIVAGDPSSDDPNLVPALRSVTDIVSPSATSLSLRAVHGAVGLPPFDVVINGETALVGVRYNTAIGYPYSSASGYAQIAAGIPEGSTLLLRSGTTVKSFTVPTRIRRGIADTLVVTGSSVNSVAASICSDRAPESGATSADCIALSPAH